jgi:hypothetical protein
MDNKYNSLSVCYGAAKITNFIVKLQSNAFLDVGLNVLLNLLRLPFFTNQALLKELFAKLRGWANIIIGAVLCFFYHIVLTINYIRFYHKINH